ncbi:MAG: hypothetical protein M3495_09550 [Pseudomonadota bacterium]|nr:hypothetical protein [Gammaproteobacteria bacterium]MDQ3581830.1 hypothetical protein [Pseudomonadota bacterium]
MNDKTDRRTALIALALVLCMAATRSDHFAGELHLPDASAAVFFLAGVYLRPMWIAAALLVEAALIDYAAIAFGGVSSFCISPAYGFLLPAYGALWLAGRWYAVRHRFAFSTLLPLAASVVIGGLVSELFSSGGFYFFSGRFEPNLAELGARIARDFPSSLATLAFYVAVAAIVHVAFGAVRLSGARDRRALGGN